MTPTSIKALALVCFTVLTVSAQPVELPAGKLRIERTLLDGVFVTDVKFDAKGTVWIGTFNEGIAHWDGKRIVRMTPENSDFPKTGIRELALDAAGKPWIATSAGLIHYDGKKIDLFSARNSNMPVDNVSSVAVDAKDRVWFTCSVSTKSSLMCVEKGVIREVLNKPFMVLKNVAIDRQDNVWVTGYDSVKECGAIRLSGQQKQIWSGKDFGFEVYNFGRLLGAPNGDLFFTMDYALSSAIPKPTDPQLVRFGKGGWETLLVPQRKEPGFLREVPWTVQVMAADNNGQLWISDGRELASLQDGVWKEYPGIKFQDVFCLSFDPFHRLWVGTGKGIQILRLADIPEIR